MGMDVLGLDRASDQLLEGGVVGAEEGGMVGAEEGGVVGAEEGGMVGAEEGGVVGAEGWQEDSTGPFYKSHNVHILYVLSKINNYVIIIHL